MFCGIGQQCKSDASETVEAMKKFLQIALGIVTSVGGFLEIGSVTTASHAGASFW
jgi:hypothetical protein